MGIVAWIIFGPIAGVIAKLIMPGNDRGGLIITIPLGIAGALVGLYRLGAGFGPVVGFNFGGFMIAILGAILLLWLHQVIKN